MKIIYRVLFLCSTQMFVVSMNGMLNLSTKRLKDFRLLKQMPQQRFIQMQKPQILTLSPLWLGDKFSGLTSTIKNYWHESSIFAYKNMLSSYFHLLVTKNLLKQTWKKNPSLAEDLGLFIFQWLSKKTPTGVYITDGMGACLVEVVKIFLINGKDIPEGLIEFIVLHDKRAFSHFNSMAFDVAIQKDEESSKVLLTKFFERFIPIVKEYKQAYMGWEGFHALDELLLFRESGKEGKRANRIDVFFDVDVTYSHIPSYRHLENYFNYLNRLETLFDAPNIRRMVQHIMYKEKELIDDGYEVFYHGRRWKYGFLSDIYGMLYSYKSGKELNDFMFTQMDDPVLGKVSEKFYAAEAEKRERLIKEGNPYNSKKHSFGIANRQSLLFLNKFLFSNLHALGSCSMHYVLKNENAGDIAFPVEEIFKMFGCYDVYQEFEKELSDLQKEYNNLTQYGEMLQIAIPKDNVDKCIYYTTSGGPKMSFMRNLYNQFQFGPVRLGPLKTDIRSIIQELNEEPDDITEFALVETRDKFGGLNSESGIKVSSYNVVDPEKWRQFKEKEKELFEPIQESMRQKETKEKQVQIVRE